MRQKHKLKNKPPKVVILYCEGKENAQRVLNAIYERFKNEAGSGVLDFNEKVTDFIFFTEGHRNFKYPWPVPESDFREHSPYEKNMVYYDVGKLKKRFKIKDLAEKDYYLINPAKLKKINL